MDVSHDGGSCVEGQKGGRNSERSMALRGEGAVPDLGGLERDDHVGGGSEHGEVSGDGGGEGNLHPLVGCGVGEGGGEHLADRDI